MDGTSTSNPIEHSPSLDPTVSSTHDADQTSPTPTDTDELRREGIAKDLIRAIQNQRKSIDCQYTDRIEVAVQSSDDDVAIALKEHHALIVGETLANSLQQGVIDGTEPIETEYGNVYVRVAAGASSAV